MSNGDSSVCEGKPFGRSERWKSGDETVPANGQTGSLLPGGGLLCLPLPGGRGGAQPGSLPRLAWRGGSSWPCALTSSDPGQHGGRGWEHSTALGRQSGHSMYFHCPAPLISASDNGRPPKCRWQYSPAYCSQVLGLYLHWFDCVS